MAAQRIPTTPLVVACAFDTRLTAPAVASALGRGLRQGGVQAVDLCPLGGVTRGDHAAGALLAALDFDARMRGARAVIVATGRLDGRSLVGSAAFEVLTRARQAGVPAYAVTADNRLDAFEARMLDLQTILQAAGASALRTAGRELAGLI